MKILITGTTGESMPPPYGGVPKLSLLVAAVWKKMGHQVAINFAYKPVNADDLNSGAEYFFDYGSKPDKFTKAGFLLKNFVSNPGLYLDLLVSYIKISKRLAVDAILYSAYGVQMDRVITEWKPDIILSEAALIKTFMVAKIAKRHKIPVVFDTYAEIHNLSMGINKILSDVQREHYWKSFLSLADLVIAPGPYCCRGPLTYLSDEKVKFVYDGSDYSLCDIEVIEGVGELRDSLHLPKEAFLIGNVGSFESRKGQDHLIHAIAKLAKSGHPIHAVICGGSGDPTKWKKLAESEGVLDRVHFFGRLPERDLARMFKSLDAFSDLENTPRACGLTMSILEGMAMGLPVVVYNNRELFEVVKENVNGFGVPIDDVDALAAAILRMYQLSPEVRREMGAKAALEAKRIDIDFTAQGKMVLFNNLINAFKV